MSSCASCKTCQEELLAAVADAASPNSNLDAQTVSQNEKNLPNDDGTEPKVPKPEDEKSSSLTNDTAVTSSISSEDPKIDPEPDSIHGSIGDDKLQAKDIFVKGEM